MELPNRGSAGPIVNLVTAGELSFTLYGVDITQSILYCGYCSATGNIVFVGPHHDETVLYQMWGLSISVDGGYENLIHILMAQCNSAVTPVHKLWSYCSFAISHHWALIWIPWNDIIENAMSQFLGLFVGKGCIQWLQMYYLNFQNF